MTYKLGVDVGGPSTGFFLWSGDGGVAITEETLELDADATAELRGAS